MTRIVLLPTFNERDNILAIIDAILTQPRFTADILVIDDNSPDGTADLVQAHYPTPHAQVHVLRRSHKAGLGPAYIAGFQWALARDYQYIIQMDADFSHSPRYLPLLTDTAEKNHGLVIGSRYVVGGNTVNWTRWRKLISRLGGRYAKTILNLPIHDLTGGFKCFHRDVLARINLDEVRTVGYAFQIEMTFRAALSQASIKEVPITFEERRQGQSKMSYRIVLEALYQVILLRLSQRAITNQVSS